MLALTVGAVVEVASRPIAMLAMERLALTLGAVAFLSLTLASSALALALVVPPLLTVVMLAVLASGAAWAAA